MRHGTCVDVDECHDDVESVDTLCWHDFGVNVSVPMSVSALVSVGSGVGASVGVGVDGNIRDV